MQLTSCHFIKMAPRSDAATEGPLGGVGEGRVLGGTPPYFRASTASPPKPLTAKPYLRRTHAHRLRLVPAYSYETTVWPSGGPLSPLDRPTPLARATPKRRHNSPLRPNRVEPGVRAGRQEG